MYSSLDNNDLQELQRWLARLRANTRLHKEKQNDPRGHERLDGKEAAYQEVWQYVKQMKKMHE